MTAATAGASRWTALPHFFLRQAGFAFDTLDLLAAPEVARLADEIGAVGHAVDQRRAVLLRVLRSDGTGPAARVHRLVAGYRPVSARRAGGLAGAVRQVFDDAGWNDALARVAARRLEFLDAYRDYQRAYATNLRDRFLADPALLDALLLSNEDNFEEIAAWLRRFDPDRAAGKDRRRLDLLVMYMQRFCAKNDTNAHFGPISVGDVRPDAPSLTHELDGALRRYTFASRWAVDALAAAAHADGALECRPRTVPSVLIEGDPRAEASAYQIRYRFAPHWDAELVGPLPLGPEEADLLRLCDGSRTTAEVTRTWLYAGERDAAAALAELAVRGLVVAGPDLPVGTPYPLDEFAKDLTSGSRGAHWHAVVTEFRERIADFGTAPPGHRPAAFGRLNELFQGTTGVEPSRGHGEHYADRSVLYEECVLGTESLVVGGELLLTVEQELGLYLDLLLLPARARLYRQRGILYSWFTEAFAAFGADDVALLEYLRRYEADRPCLAHRFDAVEAEDLALHSEIEALLLDRPPGEHGAEVVVEADRIRRFLAGRQPPVPAVCNPDVMIVAASAEAIRAGDFRIVVGDCHAVREAISHTSVSCLVAQARPDLARTVRQAYGRLLAGDELLVDLVREHDEKTAAQLCVADLDLELYGRSTQERARVLSCRDLVVRRDGGRLRLYAPLIGRYLVLTAAPIGGQSARNDPLAIFSFPRHFTGTAFGSSRTRHLPRVRMGRVVLNRETWQVSADELVRYCPPGPPLRDGDDPNGVLRLSLYRRAHGLPRHVFAAVPGEVKPVYVDFEAPVLVRQLWRLLRRRSGIVKFSEMLPGPGALWLDRCGRRTCSELRMALFGVPNPAGGEGDRGRHGLGD